MTKLISITDINEFKPLSLNTNIAKQLDPWIIEAQEFDLQPCIGNPMYVDLLDNTSNYTDLFEPFTYSYGGKTYKHEGIKSSLIYWTYARYLANINQHSTAFGMVNKVNDYSNIIEEKTTARLIKQAQSGAEAYKEQWITYLNRFNTQYLLYGSGGECGSNCNTNKIRYSGC